MSDGRLFAVAYDIVRDSRRVKVANALKAYGERTQYSVFECYLSEKELSELTTRMRHPIRAEEDSVRFYQIRPPVGIVGTGRAHEDKDLFVI